MLDVINALEKISVNAQLMYEVTSNKCEVLSNHGLDQSTIRMLTTGKSEELANQAGHHIHSIKIFVPWMIQQRHEQINEQCG